MVIFNAFVIRDKTMPDPIFRLYSTDFLKNLREKDQFEELLDNFDPARSFDPTDFLIPSTDYDRYKNALVVKINQSNARSTMEKIDGFARDVGGIVLIKNPPVATPAQFDSIMEAVFEELGRPYGSSSSVNPFGSFHVPSLQHNFLKCFCSLMRNIQPQYGHGFSQSHV